MSYDEIAAKNADFGTMYDGLRKSRNEEHPWFQLAKCSFDIFMTHARSRR